MPATPHRLPRDGASMLEAAKRNSTLPSHIQRCTESTCLECPNYRAIFDTPSSTTILPCTRLKCLYLLVAKEARDHIQPAHFYIALTNTWGTDRINNDAHRKIRRELTWSEHLWQISKVYPEGQPDKAEGELCEIIRKMDPWAALYTKSEMHEFKRQAKDTLPE